MLFFACELMAAIFIDELISLYFLSVSIKQRTVLLMLPVSYFFAD